MGIAQLIPCTRSCLRVGFATSSSASLPSSSPSPFLRLLASASSPVTDALLSSRCLVAERENTKRRLNSELRSNPVNREGLIANASLLTTRLRRGFEMPFKRRIILWSMPLDGCLRLGGGPRGEAGSHTAAAAAATPLQKIPTQF